jgi:hypothetical protein
MAAASARRADKGLGRRAAPLVSAAPLARPCSAPASRPVEGSGQATGCGFFRLFNFVFRPLVRQVFLCFLLRSS